jgi:hypothetical protein
MDYLTLGSNGFAQLGQSGFHQKIAVEMRVLLSFFREKYPIPRMFRRVAYYTVKSFDHDFGSYQEIVLWYDRDHIDSLEESENPPDSDFYELFWSWLRVIESADLESQQLTEQIQAAYLQSIDISKGEHLSVSVA